MFLSAVPSEGFFLLLPNKKTEINKGKGTHFSGCPSSDKGGVVMPGTVITDIQAPEPVRLLAIILAEMIRGLDTCGKHSEKNRYFVINTEKW